MKTTGTDSPLSKSSHPKGALDPRQWLSPSLTQSSRTSASSNAPLLAPLAIQSQNSLSVQLPAQPHSPDQGANSSVGTLPRPPSLGAPLSHRPSIKSTLNTIITELPNHAQVLIPSLVSLADRIVTELEANIVKLLSLNPSRREAIAAYLDQLAGHLPSPPDVSSGFGSGAVGAGGRLLKWIQGPRTPLQDAAIQNYFEEVALITLGQALVLKNWSDLGLRKWNEGDLSRINWAMSTALKPHVPHDRRGWQITQPNLYSWYNPSPAIQKEVWSVLENWSQLREETRQRLGQNSEAQPLHSPLSVNSGQRLEGPHFLTSLFYSARQARLRHSSGSGLHLDPEGFDWRFYQAIWQVAEKFGLPTSSPSGPLSRVRHGFSPTLRDGAVARSGPADLRWIGLECSPYQLMLAELALLWWAPTPPPCWELGNGLEVHTRDQLSLTWNSPKPSVLSRIAEMEACDIAFVFEERCTRAQGRSPETTRFKEQVDAIPYFRKLKSAGTSLGDLQACVALSKLRPGGLLWWAREEPLAHHDGHSMLNFLLDRGELVAEWDFTDLQHHLPSSIPLLPKSLYLFRRVTEVEKRLSHRPLKCVVHGQLRSHVEFPLLLRDAFEAALDSSPTTSNGKARGSWQVQRFISPTPQKEWADRWPDPLTQVSARALERLRSDSDCLASVATIRHTPEGDPQREMRWTVDQSLKGFWIQAEASPDGRRLKTFALPRPGKEVGGSGCMILFSDESWIAPMQAYLETPAIKEWLDLNAERKNEKWVITEQVVKFIPVPKSLIAALNPALRLNGSWERILSEVGTNAEKVQEQILKHTNTEGESLVRASCFVRATRAREHLLKTQDRILSMVGPQGQIQWRNFFDLLPASELISVQLHAEVQLQGNLPNHIAVERFDMVKSPQPGVLLSTESGYRLQLSTHRSLLLDMIWDQLQGLKHPTWSELTKMIRLPRRLEAVEATGRKVLEAHALHSKRLKELNQLVSACSNLV
jgi:hypothetical protein